MIFNGNKFGRKDESTNNSISPTRRVSGTGASVLDPTNRANKSPNNIGTARDGSANSSGKFSVRNALAGGTGQGPSGTGINDSMRGEPLELMSCPSHENQPLDHYSIKIREFMCKQCIREIEGTQREIDLNPIPVEEAFKILENRLNMQQLVNLDEKIKSLLELVKKKKDFA